MKSKLLDCTLRDGSYANNFNFSKNDTSNLCKALQNIGIEFIEIGHGVGISASEKGFGKSAVNDLLYMKAASKVLKKSKWGMFCIPNIAEIDDVKEALEEGMGFIRIGINPEDLKSAVPFIELVKKRNIFTCVNFMKSYTKKPIEFANLAVLAENYGADLVYIVDSAGGMLPEELEEYFISIKEKSSTISLGFHGHNNLGLGVANSLKAVEYNANLIDVSLQGFGRGAGNTPSEQFVCALIRKGIDINIDPIKIMDISEKYYDLLSNNKVEIDSIDTISGLSLFHSSYMNIIQKYANKYQVDPRKLIINLCKFNNTNAPEHLVENIAIKLKSNQEKGSWKNLYKHYFGKEQ